MWFTCIPWPDHVVQNVKDTISVRYCLIGQIQNQVKFMNTSTEHILQCNQSEPLADASGRIVDLKNENVGRGAHDQTENRVNTRNKSVPIEHWCSRSEATMFTSTVL